MNFTLLELELHKESQSWMILLKFGCRSLIDIEWSHDGEVTVYSVFFIRNL